MAITKYVLPVVVGVMAGVILITFGEMGLHHIYPLPAGIGMNDKAALAEAMSKMPVNAFLLLLLNYIVCSFLAGMIATLVAGRSAKIPAIVVGIALTLAGAYNIVMVPQPLWFSAVNLLSYLPFAYVGYLSVKKGK